MWYGRKLFDSVNVFWGEVAELLVFNFQKLSNHIKHRSMNESMFSYAMQHRVPARNKFYHKVMQNDVKCGKKWSQLLCMGVRDMNIFVHLRFYSIIYYLQRITKKW